MNTTESTIICACCDAPFLPSVGDLCPRCDQRRKDRIDGGKAAVWMLGAIALTLWLGLKACSGSVVTEEFLDGIAQRESNNNPAAIGRHGERGAYQLRPCAVQEVNNRMGWTCSHRVAAVQHGRAYARAYCLIVEARLSNVLGRSPSQPEVYNAFRLGPSGFTRNARRQHTPLTRTKSQAYRGLGLISRPAYNPPTDCIGRLRPVA